MGLVNIVCTKYGDLYDASFVNKLYEMVGRNTNFTFNFWCQTEDSNNISSEIQIIPIKEVSPKEKRYHKISLLESEYLTGRCVFFDLDIIINSNIDHYISYSGDKIAVLYAHYKDADTVKNNNKINNGYNGMINSSIFSWDAHSTNTRNVLDKHYCLREDVFNGSFDRFLFWKCLEHIAIYKYNDYNHYISQGFDSSKTFCIFNNMIAKDTIKIYWD